MTFGVAVAACSYPPRAGQGSTASTTTTASSPATSSTTSTSPSSSTTTTTAPPGGPPPGLLDLRRDGIYAQNGALPLRLGQATLAAWQSLLGQPDQVVSHLPVAGATRCVDENGRPRDYLDANQTVRWGDLRVIFADHRIMVGYLYGPRVDARPLARFRGVAIGDKLGDLIRSRLVDVAMTRNATYGFPFREVGDDLGVHGFASGTTENDTVEEIFSGYECFGLAR